MIAIPLFLKFIALPIIVWFVSQTIKFAVRSFSEKNAPHDLLWVYRWAGGMPSTHTAILISISYIIGRIDNWGPLFGLSFVVTILFVYNLVVERKKQSLVESYFVQSSERGLNVLFKDGRILDISGHEISEIIGGAILGLIMGALLFSVFF